MLRVLAPPSALATAAPPAGSIAISATPSHITLAPAVSLPPAAAEASNARLSSSTAGDEAAAGAAQPEMAPASLASSIAGALFYVAIAHGVLLALAGGGLTWWRLTQGPWCRPQGLGSTPPRDGEGR